MGRKQKLRILPKVISPAAFLSPPPSPVRVNSRKAFSNPIVSLVPKELRRKGRGASFESKEPTSPKVSCMGQVKGKNKKKKKKPEEHEHHQEVATTTMLVPLHRVANVIKIFKTKPQGGRRDNQESPPGVERVLSLGHIKRLSSGRGALQNFDWRAHDIGDGSNHCADRSRNHQAEEDKEAMVVESRKDVNLWKRRNLSPPKPLKL